ncbi:MAG: VWA domain-containing protein [Planctomycetes bacterium]|nr:VWA domain-containing protein [Planctomycetota bacterium]
MANNIFKLVLGKLFSLSETREQAALDLAAEMRYAQSPGLRGAGEMLGRDVPRLPGKLYLLVDVSGSMQDAMAQRGDVRYLDLAALFAAATLKRNSAAEVVAYSDEVIECTLGREDVMGNAQKLANLEGGGTKCVTPLKALNKRWARGDLVVYISDNQGRPNAATLAEWDRFKSRNKRAKLACIDIQPRVGVQGNEREDVLCLSGFGAEQFDRVVRFAEGRLEPAYSAA